MEDIHSFEKEVVYIRQKYIQIETSFAFSFVPGVLVDAILTGKWILLDELNLAPSEVLQRLSGLFEGNNSRFVLTERGDIYPLKIHPEFRLFGAMNPPTDVGKKELPSALRNRFTEIYVDELEDEHDLQVFLN